MKALQSWPRGTLAAAKGPGTALRWLTAAWACGGVRRLTMGGAGVQSWWGRSNAQRWRGDARGDALGRGTGRQARPRCRDAAGLAAGVCGAQGSPTAGGSGRARRGAEHADLARNRLRGCPEMPNGGRSWEGQTWCGARGPGMEKAEGASRDARRWPAVGGPDVSQRAWTWHGTGRGGVQRCPTVADRGRAGRGVERADLVQNRSRGRPETSDGGRPARRRSMAAVELNVRASWSRSRHGAGRNCTGDGQSRP